MSTPIASDLLIVERGATNTQYKETKADWDTATSSSNGIAIQMAWCRNPQGFNSSGQHWYTANGNLYHAQADTVGCYTLSTNSTATITSKRPNTKLQVGGVWYELDSFAAKGTSGTTEAGPVNVYYRRRAVSWTFTNSELQTALSTTSATITGMQINIHTPPNSSYNKFVDLQVGMKLVTSNATTNNSGTNNGSYTTVLDSFNGTSGWAASSGWTSVGSFTSNFSWSSWAFFLLNFLT